MRVLKAKTRLVVLALTMAFSAFTLASFAAPADQAMPACCAGGCDSGAMPCGMPVQPCCAISNPGQAQSFQRSSDDLGRAGSENTASVTPLLAPLVQASVQRARAPATRCTALQYGLDSPAFLCVFLI
jgi:hypothetical protein